VTEAMERRLQMLTYHLLKSAGLNIGLGETLERVLQVANDTYDSYILELSSFQLDGIVDYKTIAIITNISPII
jgi:UDP-N-acetylmuramoylalanine--D-glutamate ligase